MEHSVIEAKKSSTESLMAQLFNRLANVTEGLNSVGEELNEKVFMFLEPESPIANDMVKADGEYKPPFYMEADAHLDTIEYKISHVQNILRRIKL